MAKDKRIGNTFAQGLSTSGRPPVYEYPEKMLEKIIEYFEENDKEDLTVTGLALYLGFSSRQSLFAYGKKKEFSYIISRAKLMVESKYESNLSGSNATGSIFALKNMGWKDKSESEISGKLTQNIINLGKGIKPPDND